MTSFHFEHIIISQLMSKQAERGLKGYMASLFLLVLLLFALDHVTASIFIKKDDVLLELSLREKNELSSEDFRVLLMNLGLELKEPANIDFSMPMGPLTLLKLPLNVLKYQLSDDQAQTLLMNTSMWELIIGEDIPLDFEHSKKSIKAKKRVIFSKLVRLTRETASAKFDYFLKHAKPNIIYKYLDPFTVITSKVFSHTTAFYQLLFQTGPEQEFAFDKTKPKCVAAVRALFKIAMGCGPEINTPFGRRLVFFFHSIALRTIRFFSKLTHVYPYRLTQLSARHRSSISAELSNSLIFIATIIENETPRDGLFYFATVKCMLIVTMLADSLQGPAEASSTVYALSTKIITALKNAELSENLQLSKTMISLARANVQLLKDLIERHNGDCEDDNDAPEKTKNHMADRPYPLEDQDSSNDGSTLENPINVKTGNAKMMSTESPSETSGKAEEELTTSPSESKYEDDSMCSASTETGSKIDNALIDAFRMEANLARRFLREVGLICDLLCSKPDTKHGHNVEAGEIR